MSNISVITWRYYYNLFVVSNQKQIGNTWLNVGEVSEEEWVDSQQKLKATYSNIRSLVSHTPFDNPTQIQGALGILMHNAYHLGQIHQSLCTIKPS